jgi:hypothetical protein
MLQEKHIVHEAIKILCFERWPDFCRWKRGASGESSSFDACTSWIFLGVHGHPQDWAFVHSSSYLIILQSLHLKTSFIQNSTQFY